MAVTFEWGLYPKAKCLFVDISGTFCYIIFSSPILSHSDSLVIIPRAYLPAKPWKVLSLVSSPHSRRSLMQSNNVMHLWRFLMNTCCRRECQIASRFNFSLKKNFVESLFGCQAQTLRPCKIFGGYQKRPSQDPFIPSTLSHTISTAICTRSAFFLRRTQ